MPEFNLRSIELLVTILLVSASEMRTGQEEENNALPLGKSRV